MYLETLSQRERFYYQMVLIRYFEERLFMLFGKGELSGTTHGYVGQEANAVAVLNHLQSDDIVVSNHRCHGHYLVRTGDVTGLIAELMGKVTGTCGGRGGSQHLCKENFYTNGVLGSTVPIAAGMAYAEKKKKTGAIAVLFMGDGAFGEGTVYETFNLMSLWQVPLLVIIENNQYAQTTPLAMNFTGGFIERAQAFYLSCSETGSRDVEELYERFGKLIKRVREESCPHVEIIHTYRFCGHSKGDDYRKTEEIDLWRTTDPLKQLEQKISIESRLQIEAEVCKEIDQAETMARQESFPSWQYNNKG